MRRLLACFLTAQDGVSAVEFAFIGPLLLLTFMATVELPRAFSTGKRLNLAAATMADLISRNDFAGLSEIYAAAQAVALPYNVGNAGIVLSAVGVYPQGTGFAAKVCSSAAQNDQPRATGAMLGPAPSGSAFAGARYVMAEVRMPYAALFRMVPILSTWTFSYAVTWPVREGKTVYGQPEVILPGGQPCPALAI